MAVELAIFEDCGTLIENYVAAGEVSFASFCQQWKSLFFQHMYSVQRSNVEVIQTTAAIFHFAKRTVCARETSGQLLPPPCNDEHAQKEHLLRRTGAMFLIYAIYFKQPTERFVKLQVSPDTWREITDFISTLPSTPGADEVRYVFFKLVQEDAFRFTALDYCVGLENLVDYDKLKNEVAVTPSSSGSGQQLRQELHEYTATQRILPALTVLEAGYNEMKEMLLTADTNLSKKSLPPTTIFKSIRDSFRKIEGYLEEPSDAQENQQTEESKRRHLKRKGFQHGDYQATTIVKSDDEYTVVAEQEDEQNQQSLRRMSARTVFKETLPQSLIEDLTENDGAEENVDDDAMQLLLEQTVDCTSSDEDQVKVVATQKNVKCTELIDLN